MIIVYTGPMFSGKTTRLLDVYNLHSSNSKIIFKPVHDNRYATNEVVSHDGVKIEAMLVKDPHDIYFYGKCYDNIFIDEVQFMEGDVYGLIASIQRLDDEGKYIYISGLNLDSERIPFSATSKIMAISDTVFILTAKCKCGNNANYTHKKITNNNRFELGSDDIYEPLCKQCYNKINKHTNYGDN